MVDFEAMSKALVAERKKLFERIVKAPLRIPPDVPVDAGVAISRLLRRHPRQRLCAVGGADALRTEPFFASVDFDALVLGAVRPPSGNLVRWSRPCYVLAVFVSPSSLGRRRYGRRSGRVGISVGRRTA